MSQVVAALLPRNLQQHWRPGRAPVVPVRPSEVVVRSLAQARPASNVALAMAARLHLSRWQCPHRDRRAARQRRAPVDRRPLPALRHHQSLVHHRHPHRLRERCRVRHPVRLRPQSAVILHHRVMALSPMRIHTKRQASQPRRRPRPRSQFLCRRTCVEPWRRPSAMCPTPFSCTRATTPRP